jgi:membrane-associated protease RseP (regulator of RpoE activity)
VFFHRSHHRPTPPDARSADEVLSGLFEIHALWVHRAMVLVRGHLLGHSETALRELQERVRQRDWVMRTEPMEGEQLLMLEAQSARRFPWLALSLFLLTLISVVFVRPATMGSVPGQSFWDLVIQELPFAYALLPILLAHEFGHYLAARRHGYPASLPYFIPGIFPFGTFGAVIVARHPFRDRRVLFDVAVAGPLAGFVVAAPVVWLGLAHSQWVQIPEGAGMTVWDPLLMKLFARWTLGPSPGEGWDILLHPAAFGGWAGLFVTMMNLLPFGPLDGGKTAYALFGRTQRWIAVACWALLACTLFVSPFWTVWLCLALVFRLPHPPTLNDGPRLDSTRRWVGVAVAAVFVLSFMPFPISL